LIKRLRELSSKNGREKYSMLLLEGTHLLQEALNTDFRPNEIVATTAWLGKHQNILEIIPKETNIYQVSDSALKSALTTRNPDGVASIFPFSGLPLPPRDPKFVLALDRLQDPGNLGNLFRTCLAADIESLWLAAGVDPLNQKVIRASAGSVLFLPFSRLGRTEDEGIEQLLEKLNLAKNDGFQVLATTAPGKKQEKMIFPYWEVDWRIPTVLVLGNEGSGLHPEIFKTCTDVVTLPHNPVVESLNVAAAAVPLLLERRRAKMVKGIHK
tara:strand:- start:26956 stop:27762 length:807 start_codon:yes stop_codon:yes gene_type:complete